MPWTISIQDLAMKLVKTIFVFTYLAVIANGHKDEATSSSCLECDDLRNRLDSLEALVHKQAAVIRRQETELANQTDVIRRLLPLETEIDNLKGLSQRVNTRLVLGDGENVAFTAYLGHNMHNIQAKQKLVFEKIVTNEGGFYNSTTGIFTVPESGLYQFIFAIDTYGSYKAEASLVVDSVRMMDAIAQGRAASHNDQGCNAINVRLRRGQNVWLEHDINGD